MTLITGTEYKANPGKYMQRAHEGERVIISSHGGYVELKPVSEEDKDVKKHIDAVSFLASASKVKKDIEKGNCITLRSRDDIDRYFASM